MSLISPREAKQRGLDRDSACCIDRCTSRGNSIDECNSICSEINYCSITVYVEQPTMLLNVKKKHWYNRQKKGIFVIDFYFYHNPKKRKPHHPVIMLLPNDIRYGHAWVGLTENGQEKRFGFHPNGLIDPRKNLWEAKGRVRPEKHDRAISLSYTRKLPKSKCQKVKEFVAKTEANPPRYNLVRYNCDDYAIDVFKAAGIQLPNEKVNYRGGMLTTGGPMSTPARFGQQLIKAGGERHGPVPVNPEVLPGGRF